MKQKVTKLTQGIKLCVEAAARPTVGPEATACYAAAARDLAVVQLYLTAAERIQDDPNAWPAVAPWVAPGGDLR